MFAKRLKESRAEKGITQVQLAADLGVSKGTVAMWETGKREPNFEMLCELSDYFDRRIDYILGHSEDKSSPKMTDEDYEDLGRWEVDNFFYETIMNYLVLDEYGKYAVEGLIKAEMIRCANNGTLLPKSGIALSLRIKKDNDK